MEAPPIQRGYDLIPAQSVPHSGSTDPHVGPIATIISGALPCESMIADTKLIFFSQRYGHLGDPTCLRCILIRFQRRDGAPRLLCVRRLAVFALGRYVEVLCYAAMI